MIKLISLIPRKPGLTRQQFIDHYEAVHAPLALSLFPQIARYVRNYPTGDDNMHYAGKIDCPGLPYDAVTEQWFSDRAAYDAMMRSFASDPARFKDLSEDEDRFIDKGRMIMFLVEERDSAL